MSADGLAVLICESLLRSPAVEIDGLGVFRRNAAGVISFERAARPRVFIAYAIEDSPLAQKLYDQLEANGFDPWLDRRKLLPGQNWPRRIEEAIEAADFFTACFSRHSVTKRGGFQTEVRQALASASRVPLDEVYFVPLRLDYCRVPARITRELQYVDLFPDWDAGFAKLLRTIRKPGQRRVPKPQ